MRPRWPAPSRNQLLLIALFIVSYTITWSLVRPVTG